MRETTLINAMSMHDRALNGLRADFKAMQKVVDKAYVISLTHVMMWDALLALLSAKGTITQAEFDATLKDLKDKTKAAMDAEQKKKADEAALAAGKTTVLSETPAIPVITT